MRIANFLFSDKKAEVLHRKIRMAGVAVLQNTDEVGDDGPLVAGVGTEHAGNGFFAVERRPGKFVIVVVQETGRQADTFVGSHVGEGGVVVVAVKVVQMQFLQHPLLYGAQFRLGTAAHHQRAPCQIVRADDVFLRQRIGGFADEINFTAEQGMDFYIGNAFHIFFPGKDNILFAP